MTKLTELVHAQQEQLEFRKELYESILSNCVGLSPFQCAWLLELVRKPEFRDFVLMNGDMRETFHRPSGKPRPFTVLWYDTADQLHSVRLGQLKVLQKADA